MTIEVVAACPLGAKCEEIKNDKIHRCAWYIQLAGTDPTTGSQVDKHACAMAWLPVLLVENSMQQRSTGAAVESFRNEMVRAQDAVIGAAMASGALAASPAMRPAIEVSETTGKAIQ